VLKSIIFGNVHHYWYQNSNIDDYQHVIQQFALRLKACRQVKVDLIPISKEAFTACGSTYIQFPQHHNCS
jgi:hypothetical protein